MIGFRFNWRWLLALLGIAIVSGTIFYSQYLAQKIQMEEQQKIEQWLAASKAILNPDLTLPNLIRNEQHSIPIIETNENDSITDNNIPYPSSKRTRTTASPIISTWIH